MNATVNETTRPLSNTGRVFRIRLGLAFTFVGFALFMIGIDPGLFNLDRSQPTGFIQIAVFLIGLAFICIGGYLSLNALWNGSEKSIIADVGLRLVSTGYVVAVASAMADVFGFGNHHYPKIPYFGPVQAIGVMIGELVIAVGFLLLIPYKNPRKKS